MNTVPCLVLSWPFPRVHECRPCSFRTIRRANRTPDDGSYERDEGTPAN